MHKNYELPENNTFRPGHAACPGCGEAIALRLILSAIGKKAVLVVPPSCISVIVGMHPLSSIKLPIYQTAFETSAAAAAGISRALKVTGQDDVLALAIAGDGGTYDIGFQSLSSVAERNEDLLYICLNNEGYMNTGIQKSSATPLGGWTTSTPAGKVYPKKNFVEIMALHRISYCATATIGYPDDLVAKVEKAKTLSGTRYIDVLSPCLHGWGVGDALAVKSSRLAVDTKYYPLYEVTKDLNYTINHMPEGIPVKEFLAMQRRFRNLTPENMLKIQEETDEQFEQLLKKVEK